MSYLDRFRPLCVAVGIFMFFIIYITKLHHEKNLQFIDLFDFTSWEKNETMEIEQRLLGTKPSYFLHLLLVLLLILLLHCCYYNSLGCNSNSVWKSSVMIFKKMFRQYKSSKFLLRRKKKYLRIFWIGASRRHLCFRAVAFILFPKGIRDLDVCDAS